MARKKLTPDYNDNPAPFDFRNAKNSIPFRTPIGGGISSSEMRAINLRNLRNMPMLEAGVVSGPWKALAMFTAKLIRGGMADDALTSVNAALRVAMRAPRGPVATRLTGSVARSSMAEAEAVLSGKPSTISYPGIRTVDASAYYRAMSQILGRYAGRLPLDSIESAAARTAGGVLKNQARLWRNIK